MPLQWVGQKSDRFFPTFASDGLILLQIVKVVALSRLFADEERTAVVVRPPPTSA